MSRVSLLLGVASLASLPAAMADGITAQMRVNILWDHNNARRTLANPTASNMLELQWDSALETVAQNYANKCSKSSFQHNAARTTQYTSAGGTHGSYVGENWYSGGPDNATDTWFGGATKMWTTGTCLGGSMSGGKLQCSNYVCSEMNAFYQVAQSDGNLSCTQSSSQTGHFTQVMWATTGYVGCGYTAACGTVCDYAPGGNVNLPSTPQPANVWKLGAPASACPTSAPYNNNGLCSTTDPGTNPTTAPTTTPSTTTPTTTASPTTTTTPTTTASPTTTRTPTTTASPTTKTPITSSSPTTPSSPTNPTTIIPSPTTVGTTSSPTTSPTSSPTSSPTISPTSTSKPTGTSSSSPSTTPSTTPTTTTSPTKTVAPTTTAAPRPTSTLAPTTAGDVFIALTFTTTWTTASSKTWQNNILLLVASALNINRDSLYIEGYTTLPNGRIQVTIGIHNNVVSFTTASPAPGTTGTGAAISSTAVKNQILLEASDPNSTLSQYLSSEGLEGASDPNATSGSSSKKFPAWAIGVIIAVAIVVVGAIVGVIVWKRKHQATFNTNQTQMSSRV